MRDLIGAYRSSSSSKFIGRQIVASCASGDSAAVIAITLAPAANPLASRRRSMVSSRSPEFLVTRANDARGITTVEFAVSGTGTFMADADDFGGTFPSGTVTFNDGETSVCAATRRARAVNREIDRWVAISGGSMRYGVAEDIGEPSVRVLVTAPQGASAKESSGVRFA